MKTDCHRPKENELPCGRVKGGVANNGQDDEFVRVNDLKTLVQMYPGLDIKAFAEQLFNKNTVAPGRIIATVVVFQFGYLLLSRFWAPIQGAFGWLLSPLGQNSLYSYTMHVVIIGGFYILLPYLPGNLTSRGLINTSLQLGVLLALWGLIRRQFGFDVVPR